MEVEQVIKLFDDTYLGIFDNCLAVAKVNENGEIVRMTTFGEKGESNDTQQSKAKRQ